MNERKNVNESKINMNGSRRMNVSIVCIIE